VYQFDEYDEWFRSPQGALTQEDVLRLRLMVKTGAVENVSIILAADGLEEHETDMRWTHVRGQYDVYEGEVNFNGPDLYWLHFKIKTPYACFYADREGFGENAPFQVTVYDKAYRTPDWIKGGVIYHIFVDRYFRGNTTPKLKEGEIFREDWGGTPSFAPNEEGIVLNNDFFGGTLTGIIEKLPELEELGVTCLYLSPIFEAASNHKYDTGDYMKIDSAFGDEHTFETLCDDAGKRGIHVLCDGVFNHVGEDSRYFNRYGYYSSIGAYQSQQSPYYNWFTFSDWNKEYECWWGIHLLPKLNANDETFRGFITGEEGVLEHWMKRGCSGWRLDVVDELPDVFLNPLCATVKRKDKDALIIGEVWEDASNKIAYGTRRKYFLGGQLDSVMNYPLRDAVISFVKKKDAKELTSVMAWLTANYPKASLNCLMNILGTHDTMRILTVLGGENFPDRKEEMAVFSLTEEQRLEGRKRLKIASLLQFTLPGVPAVYYGDEAGMEGCADPFNRKCYPWGDEDMELLTWYRKLSRIRKELPAFKQGIYRLIRASGGLFVFSRGEGEERVTVAVNVSEEDISLPFEHPMYNWLDEKITEKNTVLAEGAGIYSRLTFKES